MAGYIRKLGNTRIIALSFLAIILTGSLLLMLPVSSANGHWTPFINTLFTATSATCVTGLVVYDTGTYWSVFGQIVILIMIQIGGLGLVTVISLFPILMKKKIGLSERELLMQSSGNLKIGGIVRLLKNIIKATAIFEGSGCILLAFRFIPKYGIGRGIYFSVFHAVSAFCNAGFDLMGNYSSLTSYEADPLVNITIMLLIISGGLGFFVWDEIWHKRFKTKDYSLHSKIAVMTTLILLAGGTAGFMIFEHNGDLKGLPVQEQFLASAFMSVTTRTAGFNTINLSTLSRPGSILSIILMLIGGCPGSTAGGIKTTTIAVVILSVICLSRGEENVTVYNKRLEDSLVKHAAVVILVYIMGALTAGMIISSVEPYETRQIMFEIASAAGTVGLTMGITPKLCAVSKIVLIILMYGGRIGGMTLLMVFREKHRDAPVMRPTEKVMIG